MVVKEFVCCTSAERMGRKTVRVAGLEANSVTADTSRQANRVTAQGGRPLMGSSCLPIHTDRPDTCTHTHTNTQHVSRLEVILKAPSRLPETSCALTFEWHCCYCMQLKFHLSRSCIDLHCLIRSIADTRQDGM